MVNLTAAQDPTNSESLSGAVKPKAADAQGHGRLRVVLGLRGVFACVVLFSRLTRLLGLIGFSLPACSFRLLHWTLHLCRWCKAPELEGQQDQKDAESTDHKEEQKVPREKRLSLPEGRPRVLVGL